MRAVVENQIPKDTTIHWHGVRVPNAMDGAPYVTQPPIQPEESFIYEFAVPDAGTYWYHPHAHSPEEVGRGLNGAFIVEEPEPRIVEMIVPPWKGGLPTMRSNPPFWRPNTFGNSISQ